MNPKLLLDQNLSFKLLDRLQPVFPGSDHVRLLGLDTAPDQAIWRYAADHGFTLISKDADFHHLSLLRGIPPKVIWLRIGNVSTIGIARMLDSQSGDIIEFCADPDTAFLVLD